MNVTFPNFSIKYIFQMCPHLANQLLPSQGDAEHWHSGKKYIPESGLMSFSEKKNNHNSALNIWVSVKDYNKRPITSVASAKMDS